MFTPSNQVLPSHLFHLLKIGYNLYNYFNSSLKISRISGRVGEILREELR